MVEIYFRYLPHTPSSQLMYVFNPNQLNQGDDVIINQWEWCSDDNINYKVIPRMAQSSLRSKFIWIAHRVSKFHLSSCMPSIRTNWTKETTSSSINENDDLMTFHMIHFALALNLWRFDTKIERYACFDQKDEHDSGYMILIQVCKN